MKDIASISRSLVRIGVGLTLFAGIAAAEPPAATPLGGKQVYMRYCSACHGESGRGDGIVSGLMRPHPTDLTLMTKHNEGSFPFMRTVQILDGRQMIRAHGDPDMPVWGEILRDPSRPGALERADVTGNLMLITTYLESIQSK